MKYFFPNLLGISHIIIGKTAQTQLGWINFILFYFIFYCIRFRSRLWLPILCCWLDGLRGWNWGPIIPWWLYLGKLLVVPNFFHLILTENTMALGNFNFSCILPTFVPIHNLVSGLQSYLCIGFVSHIRCQTIYRYVNVFF